MPDGALHQHLVEDIGITGGRRPGLWFARHHAVPASGSTLLRLMRRVLLPPAPAPAVLGVDALALRRNHQYRTFVADLERYRVLDLWPKHTAEPLVTWLEARDHPSDILCRDRSGAYADAAQQAAPGALHIADCFHLVCNASDVLERTLVRHATAIRAATSLAPSLLTAAGPVLAPETQEPAWWS